MIQAPILIDKDVILDGEGNLTMDGSSSVNRVLPVLEIGGEGTVELRGLTVTDGSDSSKVVQKIGEITIGGGGILNQGTLTLTNSAVSGVDRPSVEGAGIKNEGTLTLMNSTVSGNTGPWAGGIANFGTLTLMNSTVSGNSGQAIGGIWNGGTLTATNSTVSGNIGGGIVPEGITEMRNTVVDDDCVEGVPGNLVSLGYNIESPGNTCGFDQTGDQSGVSAVLLDLQPLANNGGPTQTHAITTDSAAFNAGTCEVDEDQRGVTRPQGPACDVGAFELEQ
jgi:hypothetical protein